MASGASRIVAPGSRRFPWYVRLIFAIQRRRYGAELESARAWGRIPKALLSVSLLYASLDHKRSPIDPELRSLILVRVSQLNSCAFCVDLNSMVAGKRGASEEKLAQLPHYAVSDAFSPTEKAALAFAEAISVGERPISAALFAQVREHFDDQAIVELVALIAFQNMASKFNAALDIPAQGFCAPAMAVELGKQTKLPAEVENSRKM